MIADVQPEITEGSKLYCALVFCDLTLEHTSRKASSVVGMAGGRGQGISVCAFDGHVFLLLPVCIICATTNDQTLLSN